MRFRPSERSAPVEGRGARSFFTHSASTWERPATVTRVRGRSVVEAPILARAALPPSPQLLLARAALSSSAKLLLARAARLPIVSRDRWIEW